MNQKPYHIAHPLSAEVLRAYLQGDLSDSQQEQVAAIIAQHSIYKEVLEGLRWVDDEYPLEERLTAMSARVAGTTRIKRLHPYRLMAVAAALVLLLVAGTLLIRSLQESDKQPMAVQTPVDATPAPEQETHPTPISVDTPIAPVSVAPTTRITEDAELTPPPPPQPSILSESVQEEQVIAVYDQQEDLADDSKATVTEEVFLQTPEIRQQGVSAADARISAAPETTSTKRLAETDGFTAYRQQEYSLAIQLLTPVANTDTPEGEQATYYIGMSFAALGDIPASIEWLEKLSSRTGVYPDSARVALQKLR